MTLIETKKKALETGESRASRIAAILDDLKAEEIIVLDLHGIADFTDFFVIATVRSTPQMRAAGERIYSTLRKEGLRPFMPIEDESPNWTIIDYGDVIVHLFEVQARGHYNLEDLWGDASALEWREATA